MNENLSASTNANRQNEPPVSTDNNLQTIVVIGHCHGDYINDDVSKEFEGKMLAMVRPNGSLVVQNMNAGIRPVCYIGSGADISLARNVVDAEIELMATTDDGQQLNLQFDEVYGLCGVPGAQKVDSLAMTILRCVSDLEGKYGRVRIARLLTGSTSKCVLTMSIDELRTYGIARGASQKEMLYLIDWLLDEKYLGYSEEDLYPTLTLTEKGRQTMGDVDAGGDNPLAHINDVYEGEEFAEAVAALKDWRRARADEINQPLFFVMQNKTIEELATRRPETIDELKNIYGIGETRAESFGHELLGILTPAGEL